MTCPICHGAKQTVIEREKDIVIEPCNRCLGEVRSCRQGHQPITYRGPACPLCAALDAPTKRLYADHNAWADRTFGGKERLIPTIKHLAKEAAELLAEPHSLEEHADILLLEFRAACLAGYSYEQLLNAAVRKFGINRQRKWAEPDAEGLIEHVRA